MPTDTREPVGDRLPSRNARDWHRPHCYGCGPENEHGLHADFAFDESSGEVRFTYRPNGFEIGAPGFVHGGVLAAIMDEAQGVLCFHVGHIVMTDELRMKYHRATPLEGPSEVRCWITAVRKRRMYTRGTITAPDGSLLVSSSAVWYLLPERLMRRLFSTDQDEGEAERIRGVVEANRRRAREIRKRLRSQTRPPERSA